ncbi:flagellar motor switch protein FliM [Aurantiacibacter poecillastricola]|uniref:flagellar motor switch protein FliM n=1 Tax=Aurantiacibacter poecillastricola TaxID=3064385 RepID=UPI0035A3226D
MLAARAPELGEVAKALAAKSAKLEAAMADALGDLLGGTRPQVNCGKVEKAVSLKLHKVIDPVAANFRFADIRGCEILASVDYHGALKLTDCVFGGSGEWSAASPARLPASVDLTLRHFAVALGAGLSEIFDCAEPFGTPVRSDVLGKFVSARDTDTFLVLRLDIAVGEAKPWHVLLVWRQAHAAQMLDERALALTASGPGDRRRPDAKPFADIPLPLTAVLARMSMPVSRISALQPGDTIPLSIGRHVALKLADTEIARGEVGASDGALALRLTSIAWNSLKQGHEQ